MRTYLVGGGSTGAWPPPTDSDAVVVALEPGASFEEQVESILGTVPEDCGTVLAHSAGAVPAVLAIGAGRLRAARLVLVEPALYDVARGHVAIENHIRVVESARGRAEAGDLFGYWALIRPLMFGGPAEEADWEIERPRAEQFFRRGVPWGSGATPAMIESTPTLVITGAWNAEYEEIAATLTRHGARHEHLSGARHRPQDLPGFAALVRSFEESG